MWILLLISLSAPVQVLPMTDPGSMVDCFWAWEKEWAERTAYGEDPLIGEQLICMRIE